MPRSPLINVLLVLLASVILQAGCDRIGTDPPGGASSDKPEDVGQYIGADGRIVWNGTIVPVEQLDAYMAAAAGKQPQSEIHLHPDRHARYDDVARVLASAQRHRIRRMGFVNTRD